MPPFSTVDIIIIGLLAIGILRGVFRGLSGELASLIGIATAAFAGWHFYRPLGLYLTDTTRMSEIQSDTVSFLVIIVGAMIVLWAVSLVLKCIMEFTFKGLIERVGGAMVGGLRYALMLAILLLVASQFSSGAARQHLLEESLIGRHALEQLVPLYEDLVERYPELPAIQPTEEPPEEDTWESEW